MNQKNQYKPCPPEDQLRQLLIFYYNLGLNDKKIAAECLCHFDTENYGLSPSTVKRLRRKWGLKSTRQQNHTFESIAGPIEEIRRRFPLRGSENIRKNLRQEYGMRVSRLLVSDFLTATEPLAVEARRHHRFKRKRFWCAGVNDVWCQDQHDKWLRFGLFFHNSVDPFMSYNNWLKVWWTNKNPRLITSFYIEAARKLGGIPLVTQSDPGSENFGVANSQTMIRHRLDPTLSDTMQHRWMRKKHNIKSEANWSIFRRDFTPGFEDILDHGVNNGWYNVDDPVEHLVFRWLAIPWIQAELDRWIIQRNQTAPRKDKNKILPHGIPELIRLHPERYNSLDFKVVVPNDLLDEAERLYAPRDHPVFQLVPPPFEDHAQALYARIGRPPVSSSSFWVVYLQLLQAFRNLGNAELTDVLESYREVTTVMRDDDVPLLSGLRELRNGDDVVGPHGERYIGGGNRNLRNPTHLQIDSSIPETAQVLEYAVFTDEEDDGSDSDSNMD